MSLITEVEGSLARLPRQRLSKGASPTRLLSHVSRHVKVLNSRAGAVYLKDDGALSELYGGNKVRKLEFILGDALASGAREVWTIGGLGSHHVLATALHCQRLGLGCRAFHVHQPLTAQVRFTLSALVAAQAKLQLMTPPAHGERLGAAVHAQRSAWLEAGRSARGEAPYFIPSGGSSALGTLGYLLAAFELKRDIEAGRLPMVDHLYVAAGSGSTLAGLALGASLAGLPAEVIGVQVAQRSLINERVVRRLIRETVALISSQGLTLSGAEEAARFRLLSGHLGLGYGHQTARGQAALSLAAQDGLSLDHIYTAKAMGALISEAPQRRGVTLFWGSLSAADLSPLLERSAELGGLTALPLAYQGLLSRAR